MTNWQQSSGVVLKNLQNVLYPCLIYTGTTWGTRKRWNKGYLYSLFYILYFIIHVFLKFLSVLVSVCSCGATLLPSSVCRTFKHSVECIDTTEAALLAVWITLEFILYCTNTVSPVVPVNKYWSLSEPAWCQWQNALVF